MTQDILGRSQQKAPSASPAKFSRSPGNLSRAAFFILGGASTGLVGWSGNPLLFPVGIAFPALWAFAPSRGVAAFVALAHFLGASRGLPAGASIFFGEQLLVGFAFWGAASLVFVLVHALLWPKRGGWHRPAFYALANVLMSVPPLGIMGWANPITAAGIVFPGWGWFGLAAMATGLLVMTTRAWPVAALVLGGLYAWSAATWTPPGLPEGWSGINTTFRFSERDQYADYGQHIETIGMVREAVGKGATTVVLPESALGLWNVTAEKLWQRELSGSEVKIIGGAAVVDPHGYENALILLTSNMSSIVYKQRIPVPVSMWQPWTNEGAHAEFFRNPTITIGKNQAAALICYELLLIWPVLQSLIDDPDLIIASGNGWWTGGSNIVSILKASSEAWASLFGVPLVMAFNE